MKPKEKPDDLGTGLDALAMNIVKMATEGKPPAKEVVDAFKAARDYYYVTRKLDIRDGSRDRKGLMDHARADIDAAEDH